MFFLIFILDFVSWIEVLVGDIIKKKGCSGYVVWWM